MEPRQHVQNIWNWLPAFRMIAETEHLPTAARRLFISASALSRTLRLLEDQLGVPLFHRVGRRLVLNDAGRALLERTRSAMRLVHDAMEEITDQALTGDVRISSVGMATEAFVIPAMVSLRREHPGLRISLRTMGADQVADALARGDIDVAVQSVPVHDPRTSLHTLTQASNGIYCGPGHPLYEREEVTLHEIAHHPFAGPPPDALGHTTEGWPDALERQQAWSISQMSAGIAVCLLGDALAVLPDVVAQERTALRRLPVDVVPPTTVFALTRIALGTEGKAELTLQRILGFARQQATRAAL